MDHLKTFEALTPNQQSFFDSYKRGDYFIGLFGTAGTGKTFCSLYRAFEEVLDKSNSFQRVVVVRSCVQTRDVGFLPGTLEEKQEVYELPYNEISATLFDRPDAWARLKEQGYARFISTSAIRGISIDDAIVIVDEAQNMSFQELNTIITRVGYRSKIIFSGDWKQNDLVKSKYDTSGLLEFLNVARKMPSFTEFTFTRDDIVRSSLVKEWVIACEETGL
jgi:predicted ribonuclease YlaK